MDNGDEDTLLGIGRVLGATLESVAHGSSSITLNGVGDLDEKVMGSLGDAASKVIESTGHAVKDSTTGISNMFHGVLGGRYNTMVPHSSNNIGFVVHQSLHTLETLWKKTFRIFQRAHNPFFKAINRFRLYME